MEKTAENSEYVKYNMQSGIFYSRLAEESADCVKHAADNEKSEPRVVKPARRSEGAREHSRAAGEIDRHNQRLEFFKEEEFRGDSENSAEPSRRENDMSVKRAYSEKRNQSARSCRAREQKRDCEMVKQTGFAPFFTLRESVINRRKGIDAQQGYRIDNAGGNRFRAERSGFRYEGGRSEKSGDSRRGVGYMVEKIDLLRVFDKRDITRQFHFLPPLP